MSEFSESFHIRTDDPAAAVAGLRRARLAGITFGPANGWLTFVPYEGIAACRAVHPGDASLAMQIAGACGAVVLHYLYAADHGWSVALVEGRRIVSRFASFWHPDSVETGELDVDAFVQFASGCAEAVTGLLRPVQPDDFGGTPLAYQFADLLQLPACRWISPHDAQHAPQILLAAGGRKLGTRPRMAAPRLTLPPCRKVALPRCDLSAREAHRLAEPHLASFGRRWTLTRISALGSVDRAGRLARPNGMWRFHLERASDGTSVEVAITSTSNLVFRSEAASAYVPFTPAPALSSEWRDSTEIAAIAAAEALPVGLAADHWLSMILSVPAEAPASLGWEVNRHSYDLATGATATHTLLIDDTDGIVIAERFDRSEAGRPVEARQRLRWQGGDWQPVALEG